MVERIYDLIVVGGGVNGCGIAADAAGRGLSVALFEAEDLASATSSASSKLLHGGLRYLEHYEFRLVKEALAEREIILKMAPHVVFPLRFRLPHRSHLRPAWMIRTGLFLYDHLAKRATLPGSRSINFGPTSALKPYIRKGFEYSDGWMDDARIVVLNARLAQQKGAHIHTRMSVTRAERKEDIWHISTKDTFTNKEQTFYSRGLVNAAGPWVQRFFDFLPQEKTPRTIRLVKGSHIIVPKIYAEKEAYILQNEDKRIVFVIPYLKSFSLIGTTDIDYQGNPRDAAIDEYEINYLVNVVNQHFKHQIHAKDTLATYSGVRPLSEAHTTSAQKATRDYILTLTDDQGNTPLISVFGGKLTTYRKLSQAVLNRLKPYYPEAGGDWTAEATLPGGNIESAEAYCHQLQLKYPWMPLSLAERFTFTYGSECQIFLENVTSLQDLGENYGADFTEKELDYLIQHEWAMTLEDVIKRRTKLYLFLSQEQKKHLEQAIKVKISQLTPDRVKGAQNKVKPS